METSLRFDNFCSALYSFFSIITKNTESNYNIILPETKSLIQQWNRRILTPIDRIIIVKTHFAKT